AQVPAEEPAVAPAQAAGGPAAATAAESAEAAGGLRYLPIDALRANPHQPRQHFEPAALERLAASIRADGLMQPIVVRPAPEGGPAYELVAGERRWRAARLAGLETVPAIVRELDERQIAEWA